LAIGLVAFSLSCANWPFWSKKTILLPRKTKRKKGSIFLTAHSFSSAYFNMLSLFFNFFKKQKLKILKPPLKTNSISEKKNGEI